MHGVQPIDNVDFIHNHEVHLGKRVIYSCHVCDCRPLKEEKLELELKQEKLNACVMMILD